MDDFLYDGRNISPRKYVRYQKTGNVVSKEITTPGDDPIPVIVNTDDVWDIDRVLNENKKLRFITVNGGEPLMYDGDYQESNSGNLRFYNHTKLIVKTINKT